MKYLINKETGKRYCLHCKSYKCICLPEGEPHFCKNFATKLEVIEIRPLPRFASAIIYFYKQTLPNGRIIKSGSSLSIPIYKWDHIGYSGRFKVLLSNDIINKSFY